MKILTLYTQYGTQMLPVVVQSLKNKRVGHHSLRNFLKHAWNDLEQKQQHSANQRGSNRETGISRRDRLSISRYHDLAQKSVRSLKLALEALEKYSTKPDEHWLIVALRQFETAERYGYAQLKTRMELQPHLCERIARESYLKSA